MIISYLPEPKAEKLLLDGCQPMDENSGRETKKEAEASLSGNPLGGSFRLCRLSTYWSARTLG